MHTEVASVLTTSKNKNLFPQVICYLKPASVEEELQQGEHRDVHVHTVILVSLLGVQELSANHTEGKKGVNCNSHYLHW